MGIVAVVVVVIVVRAAPATDVADADRLIADVMRTRGYPVETFEQQAADASVDHPAG